jgi:hypothetical protein
VCSLDDPKDGSGVHDSSFCAGNPAGSADAKPEDYRRVTVEITWPQGSGTARVRQTTLVTGARRTSTGEVSGTGDVPVGGGGPPKLSNVWISAPSDAVSGYYTSGTSTTVTFRATTTSVASKVTFSVDGVYKADATTPAGGDPGTDWTWTWTMPAPDALYEISAQAFDEAGEPSGERRTLNFTRNVFVPDSTAWTVQAGRNGSVVEVEWNPATSTTIRRDRDIVGFDINTQAGTGSETDEAFVQATETSYVDPNPPAFVSGQVLRYYWRAATAAAATPTPRTSSSSSGSIATVRTSSRTGTTGQVSASATAAA